MTYSEFTVAVFLSASTPKLLFGKGAVLNFFRGIPFNSVFQLQQNKPNLKSIGFL
jgi:hypothetical protein